MKRALNRLIVILLMGIVTGSVAFAKTIKQRITLTKPGVVNGTVVKKGTYNAVFDDQTNELTILKGKEVIAKAPARLEDLSGKGPFLIFREDGDQNVLVTISFKNNQATILTNQTKASVAP
jgi:hypothetical protein